MKIDVYGVDGMATQRKKKSRFYKNLNYRFYCRNGTLPIKEETIEDPISGRKWKRSYAVLKIQTTNYLRSQYPEELKYLYNSEFDFLEDVRKRFPFLDSYSEGDRNHLYKDVIEGRLSWDDPEVKRVVSYLLSKKFWECKSSEAPFSLVPVYIRDYQREIFSRPSTTQYEKELLSRLSRENNPFYRRHELLEVEIPLKHCTVEEGKVKYFTIAQEDENGRDVPYYLTYKKDGKKKRIRITGKNVLHSLRESFDAYLRGSVKAQKGDLFYDYTRIIPIGNNRDMHIVGVDGYARRDVEAYASLEREQAEIEDLVLRDNLEFGKELF